MASTYEPISSHTLASTAVTYTFSAIPSTFTDLVLVIMAKTARSDALVADNLEITFNSDTGSNYSQTRLYGTTSALSQRKTSQTYIQFLGATGNAAASQSVTTVNIMSYANTNVYKTSLLSGGSAGLSVERQVALWRNTAAITSIGIAPQTSPWQVGSTFTLYGIKAA